MAGIYIHIPFCSQACHYCDFHFTTTGTYQERMVQAIKKELQVERGFLKEEPIETIYFGGGTPSILTPAQTAGIIDTIYKFYNCDSVTEVTLEANPEDIFPEKISDWKKEGINRISLGTQTFDDAFLKFLNRNHTGNDALKSLERLRKAGFENISLDLIYGIPNESHEQWKTDLKTALEFSPEHLSAYALTIEEKTVFGQWTRKGKLTPSEEEFVAMQFEMLMDAAESKGYDHYEISNFSKPNLYSKHNSSYWKGVNYLGVGPSAHSYNGKQRRANISHNVQYMDGIETGNPVRSEEFLSASEKANDYILTSLRTKWGLDLDKLNLLNPVLEDQRIVIDKYLDLGLITLENNLLLLTRKGKFLADEITLGLIF